MHPVFTQAIAAERARELQAHAAAAGRARHSRHGGRTWRVPPFPGGGRAPALLPPARPLRGPKAA